MAQTFAPDLSGNGNASTPVSVGDPKTATEDNVFDPNSTATGAAAMQVQGNNASAGSDTGNPVKIGGRASNVVPAAVTDGQRVDARYTQTGAATVFPVRIDGTVLFDIGDYTSDTVSRFVGHPGVRALGFYFDGINAVRARGNTDGAFSVMAASASAAVGLPGAATIATAQGTFKATAGNCYSLTVTNSTAAGYIILYDATAAPASGTALTGTLIRWVSAIAASVTVDKSFTIPEVCANGITVLVSTSPTTYTPVGTAPLIINCQYK